MAKSPTMHRRNMTMFAQDTPTQTHPRIIPLKMSTVPELGGPVLK